MIHTIADVINFQAVTGDDSFPVADVFIDGQGGRIRFVGVDIGGWFESNHAIVADSRFGEPDTRTRVWPVDISKEEIEAQPGWNEEGWFDWFSELTARPMLYAGPASMGYDPLILEQINQRDRSEKPPEKKEERADSQVDGLLRGSVLLGMAVKGHGEHLGHIGDLLFDASQMRVSHLVIDNEKLFQDSRYCVPFEQLREVDNEASEAHVNLTLHSLTDAPKRTEMEDVDQSSTMTLPGAYYHVGL